MSYRDMKIDIKKDDLETIFKKEKAFWDTSRGMTCYTTGPYRSEVMRSYLILGSELIGIPLKKDTKVLDLGSGLGRVYESLNNIGIDYYGTDISIELKKKAEKKFPNINIKLMETQTIPYLENTFDIAIANSVITHVAPKQIETILKDLYRVLKTQGGLLISIVDERYKKAYRGSCEVTPILKFIDELNRSGFHVHSIIEFPVSGYRQLLFCVRKGKRFRLPLLFKLFSEVISIKLEVKKNEYLTHTS